MIILYRNNTLPSKKGKQKSSSKKSKNSKKECCQKYNEDNRCKGCPHYDMF